MLRFCFNFGKDIKSISVNGKPTNYHYSALGLLNLDMDKAPAVHYFNRLKRSLAGSNSQKELSIEVPSNLIKKIEKNQSDLLSGMNAEVDENVSAKECFENILIRIEYDLSGSNNGLQFLNTFSKSDPQMLSVI